jgi:hypothetical protein
LTEVATDRKWYKSCRDDNKFSGGGCKASWTPTECAHTPWEDSVMETDEEHKEETIGWENEDVWVWEGAPWGMMVMCEAQGGTHPSSLATG